MLGFFLALHPMRPGYLFLALILCACSSKTEDKKEVKEQKTVDQLLEVFETVSSDTIRVFVGDNVESKTYQYNGFQLDSVDVALFPKEFVENANSDYGFFACSKFNIDENKTGLIMRTPGEYISSSLKLFVYDKQTKKLDYRLELSDVFGDEGYVMDLSAKLFFGKDKKLKCVLRRATSDNHSIFDPNDTIIDRTIRDFYIDLSQSRPDTFDIKNILNQKCYYDVSSRFYGMLKEEEFYGPPGYGENKATDCRETALILYLSDPVDIIALDETNTTYKNVTKLQLLTDRDTKDKIGQMIGAEGKLVSALTGHHHTEVLLDLKDFY